MKKEIRIALFFGGKITRHLKLIKEAARKMKTRLDLISYNRVCYETESGRVRLRNFGRYKADIQDKKRWLEIKDYSVIFFRTTGKHWEEVDLIVDQVRQIKEVKNRLVIVDPIVEMGKPSYACKAWQMKKLTEAGIAVPRTTYGSLWYLYEVMRRISTSSDDYFGSGECVTTLNFAKKTTSLESKTSTVFDFPVILKGSGGDRGTRVFKADNLEELEKLVKQLRKTETEEGKRYMLQEFIENEGDYRVLVLGEKVLGVMKRTRQARREFRNNFSMGGKVEVADLPNEVKEMAVRAAKVCGLMVAGVDVIRNKVGRYMVLEVNKGPQFKGFMEATGIDVPKEIVKFLISLKK